MERPVGKKIKVKIRHPKQGKSKYERQPLEKVDETKLVMVDGS